MEPTQPIGIDQLKEMNNMSFDLHVQNMLYDCIINELEMTIAKDKEDILLKRRVKAVLLEREKDLDEEIERSFCDYDDLVTTRVELELSECFSETSFFLDGGGSGDGVDITLAHVEMMERGVNELTDIHDKNTFVKEIVTIRRDILRFEKELKKHDEAIRKVQEERNNECQSLVERRNKGILSLVLNWKERQILHERQRENLNQHHQLEKENQELMVQLKEVERKQLSRGSFPASSSTEEHLIPMLSEFDFTQIVSSPPNTSPYKSPCNSQENSFEEKASETVSAVLRNGHKQQQQLPPLKERRQSAPVPASPPSPPEELMNIVPSTSKVTPKKKKTPQKTRSSPRIKAAEQNSPKLVKVQEVSAPPSVTPKPIEDKKSTESDVMEVIDSTPSSPSKGNQSIQDQSAIDLEHEFETFGSVSSQGENPQSPVFNDNVDLSFFGGGGGSTGDGEGDNWF